VAWLLFITENEMKLFFSLFSFFLLAQSLIAQTKYDSPQSVFSQFQNMFSREEEQKPYDQYNPPDKCGTWIHLYIREHWNEFSFEQQKQYEKLTSLQTFDEDTVIGYFHVYYYTSGINAAKIVNDNGDSIGTAMAYAESVASYFNHSLEIEVHSLGYRSPPFTPLTIQIQNLSGVYGDADPFTKIIRIDNDFSNYSTKGLNAAKVTAAHELHHILQFQYSLSAPSSFMELTSVWMEDVVYDDVNDYYFYLRSPSGHFANPSISFTTANRAIEYSRGIWGKFLEKKFFNDSGTVNIGRLVMRRTWENIGSGMDVLPAIDSALQTVGSSLADAFKDFSYWSLFIGKNADTVRYYTEGKNYYWVERNESGRYVRRDNIRREELQKARGTKIVLRDSLHNVSARYFPILFEEDTVLTVLAFHTAAPNRSPSSFRYTLRKQEADKDFYSLPASFSAKLEMEKPAGGYTVADSTWSAQEVITRAAQSEELLIYPNPFENDGTQTVKIQLPPLQQKKSISLYILASDLTYIYSENNLEPFEDFNGGVGYHSSVIQWDGRRNDNSVTASGVYFVILTIGGEKHYVGKLAIIRK